MSLAPRALLLAAPAAALVLTVSGCQSAVGGFTPTAPPPAGAVVTAGPATTLAPLPPMASPDRPEMGRPDPNALVTGDVLVSPDGEQAAASCGMRRVCVWEIASGTMSRSFDGGSTLAWSPDGSLLALTGHGMDVLLVDARTGETRHTLTGVHTSPEVMDYSPQVVAAAFSPDGATVVTAGDDGLVATWDAATGERKDRLDASTEAMGLKDVEYSPDGTRVAIAARTGATIWRPGQGVETVLRDIPAAATVSFGADGRTLAIAGQEGYTADDDEAWVRTYSTEGFRQVATVATELYPSAALGPAGELAYLSAGDRGIHLWTPGRGEPRMIGGMSWWTDAPVWAQHGTALLTASRYEGIGVWDVQSGRRLRTLVPDASAQADPSGSATSTGAAG